MRVPGSAAGYSPTNWRTSKCGHCEDAGYSGRGRGRGRGCEVEAEAVVKAAR